MAFVVSLFAVRRVLHETSLGASYATIWTTAIAAILSTAAFVVDAIVAGHIEDEIEPSPVFSVDWGIGVCYMPSSTLLLLKRCLRSGSS